MFGLTMALLGMAGAAEPSALCYPSGLRVLLETVDSRGDVRVDMLVDPAGAGGSWHLHHLTEHLWFRTAGPEDLGDARVDETLADLGALYNAGASQDWIHFQTEVPTASLREVLSLEARRLRGWSGITSDDLASEVQIIRNEVDQRMFDSGQSAVLDLRASLYAPSHPYGDAADRDALLADVTMRGVAELVSAVYRPERASISIRGPLPVPELHAALEAELGGLLGGGARRGPCPGPSADVPLDLQQTGRVEVEARVDHPWVGLAWIAPSGARWQDRAYAAEDAYATLLGARVDPGTQCMSVQRRYATEVFCFVPAEGRTRGRADRHTDARASDALERRARRVGRAIRRLDPDLDVRRLRAWAWEAMKPEERAWHRLHSFAEQGDPDWVAQADHEPGRVAEHGGAEGGWFSPERAVPFVVRPTTQPAATLPAHERDLLRDPRQIEPSAVDAARLDRVSREPALDHVHAELENGLHALVVKLPDGHPTTARLYLPHPTFAHPHAGWATGAELRAWQGLGLTAIQRHALGYTALGGLRQPDHWRFEGTVGFQDLERLLVQLRAVTEQAAVRARSLRLTRRSFQRVSEPGATELARRRRLEVLGAPWAASREALRRIALERIADAYLQAAGAVVVVAGSPLDPQQALEQVRSVFSPLEGDRTNPLAPQAPSHARTVLEAPSAPGRAQATVAMSCRLAERAPAERAVVEALLRGELTRLLRREAGWTYHVDVHASRGPRGGLLEITTDLQREAVAPATEAIVGVLAHHATHGPTEAELAAARLDAATRHARRGDATAARVEAMVRILLEGGSGSDGRLPSLGTQLMQVSAKDVRRVLTSCAGHEVFTLPPSTSP